MDGRRSRSIPGECSSSTPRFRVRRRTIPADGISRVQLYARRGKYYFQPSSKTDRGAWIASGAPLVVDESCLDSEFESTLLESIAASRLDVPHPDQAGFRAIVAPLLKAGGVRSWSKFGSEARLVSVMVRPSSIRAVPTSPGERGSFVPDWNRDVEGKRDEISELASAARRLVTFPLDDDSVD